MERIHFEVDRSDRMPVWTTPCPHGKRDRRLTPVYVGSYACISCGCIADIHIWRNYVNCRYLDYCKKKSSAHLNYSKSADVYFNNEVTNDE